MGSKVNQINLNNIVVDDHLTRRFYLYLIYVTYFYKILSPPSHLKKPLEIPNSVAIDIHYA